MGTSFLIFITTVFSLFFSGNPVESSNSYIIYLKDKKSSTYSLVNPEQYLSEKSIQRRLDKNIGFNDLDIPVSKNYIITLKANGLTVKQQSKWLNAVLIECKSKSQVKKIKDLNFIKSIKELPRKDKSKANYDSEKFKNNYADKSSFTSSALAQKTNAYGNAYHQINMINGIPLHHHGYRGQGMTIAVLDAGFVNLPNLSLFDELYEDGRLLGWYDFVNDSNWISNEHTHGTQVLSIMAGNNPNEFIGTAPMADYYLLRTEDAASEYLAEEFFWALGAEYADSVGADIINSSLGYTTFDDTLENHTYMDLDGNTTPITIAADIAASKGILVVNSAGNSGNTSWFYIGAPADGDSVFTIGGVDSLTNYAQFSSKGPSADKDLKPNVSAQASGTWIAFPWSDGLQKGNGTSFSSPIIAGMAACLWQKHPGKNNIEIMRAIEMSSHQYSKPDSLLGYGIPDFALADAILSGISLSDLNGDKLVNIFPNPSSNNFTVTFYSNSKQTILVNLFDLSGKIVNTQELDFDNKSFNHIHFSSDLSNGVYIVSIKSNDGNVSQKVIIR